MGVSGPGVVKRALENGAGRSPSTRWRKSIKRTAFRITRVGQLVAREASARLDVPFGIVDLSLAPTPAVGDSVAAHFGGDGPGGLRLPTVPRRRWRC